MLPSDCLDAPFPEEVIPDAVNKVVHWTDYLSPAHAVLTIIETVTGYNPFEDFATWLAGDWEGYGKCESAVGQLREYFAALAVDVNGAANGVDAAWDGNAGDAAVASLGTGANTIAHADSALADVQQKLRALSLTVNQTANTIVSGEEAILDLGIEAAAEAAAAAVTAETGIGALIFGGLAATTGVRILNEVRTVAQTAGAAMMWIDVGVSALLTSTSQLERLVTVPLRLTAYTFPGHTR